MAQAIRQNLLFAAEDFRIVYNSFRQQNFVSYDYNTIKTTLIEYLRNQYPENFNDWIQSSEFVAIIETLAFLSHSLAFRIDLAARENFLSTAERRESVIRIAEFLGYTPSRHLPARGFLKIKSISTTQNVYDINGDSLKGETIDFETDYQNFLLVLNETLSSINKFGSPKDTTLIGNIRNDIYTTNITTDDRDVVFDFNSLINNSNYPFEVHGVKIDSKNQHILESVPNPNSSFDLLYRNDNQGLTSHNTGFFVGFKQGSLNVAEYDIDNSIPNLVIDIDSDNVNNTDVWVQEIDGEGMILDEWIKVDSSFGRNNVFNNIASGKRKLFTVKTRDNDNISIVFGDGVFSEIPNGIIRVWYRTGANLNYTLDPSDVGTVTFSFKYNNLDNNTYDVTFEVELEESVINAANSESTESIRVNAGRVFSAQDRMITAEDYSEYPLTVSENVKKIKAINRTYVGQSRFIKYQDPTAQYQNVDLIGRDGYFYVEPQLFRSIIQLPTNLNNEEIFEKFIADTIKHPEVINMFYHRYDIIEKDDEVIEWQQVSTNYRKTTGFFTDDTTSIQRVGGTASGITGYININSLIEFEDSQGSKDWVRVIDIIEDGLGVVSTAGISTGRDNRGFGAIVLNKVVPDGVTISRVFPSFNTIFSESIKERIIELLDSTSSFGIGYNAKINDWYLIEDISNSLSYEYDDFIIDKNDENSWIIRVDSSSNDWRIYTRRIRYIFGSVEDVRFYNQNGRRKFNTESNEPDRDRITISKINTFPSDDSSIGKNIDIYTHRYYSESDGYTDDHKVIVTIADIDNDGIPDDPVLINDILGDEEIHLSNVVENGISVKLLDTNGDIDVSGRQDLTFVWRRVAESQYRVNPSISNIMDIFVLTNSYDNHYKRWISNDRLPSNRPEIVSEIELERQFEDIVGKKAAGDSIIYRPAEYKVLFGELAEPELQGRFKVIKVTGTTLTDNDIKSRVLTSINEFFNIDNWDFGETFYFTELSAYIHQNLSGVVSSIVLVPINTDSIFGELFQITPESNQLFIPDVTLRDIDIVNTLTDLI